MTMWDDERIDAAIDDAARRMTAGEPGSDFRARVMARIDGGPRFAWSWRMAAAVALAAIVAVVMVRGPRRAEVTEVRLPPSPQSGYGGQGKPDARTVAKPNASAQVRLKPDAPTVSRPNAAPATTNAEALTIPALDLEPIGGAALAPREPIAIEPLAPAPPIAVTPLGVDNEGDRR